VRVGSGREGLRSLPLCPILKVVRCIQLGQSKIIMKKILSWIKRRMEADKIMLLVRGRIMRTGELPIFKSDKERMQRVIQFRNVKARRVQMSEENSKRTTLSQ